MSSEDKKIRILAIESSCDETACAIVENGHIVLSSVVATQTQLHAKYGGVVPEIASRAHMENIYPVIAEALAEAKINYRDIDAIAVANEPGLAVALIVGVTAAKTMSFAWQKPLIGINHLHAHMQSAVMGKDVEMPAVALIVSGGHTSLYDYRSPLEPRLIGSTRDDAAGEAFDKVAAILHLSYPGGPAIEEIGTAGNAKAIRFPRTMLEKDSLDFSFSGIKTAVLYHCKGQDMKGKSLVSDMTQAQRADIAASFQSAIVDVLVKKTQMAADRIQAKTVLVGGGVSANSALRQTLDAMCRKTGRTLLIAEKKYCTDNAVMVASL
jgi:N6-L-threonylcarbamoyladenine synthase